MPTERAKSYNNPARPTKPVAKAPASSASSSDAAVRERAYLLWEKAGKPSGRDAEFWLQAKKELKS